MNKRKAYDGEASPYKVLKCSDNIIKQVRRGVDVKFQINRKILILPAWNQRKN
jgi:hypothetical protein